MSELTAQIKKIEDDILNVLKESGKPMTHGQLFKNSKLINTSEYGWGFALDNLDKQKKIKMDGNDQWTLIQS